MLTSLEFGDFKYKLSQGIIKGFRVLWLLVNISLLRDFHINFVRGLFKDYRKAFDLAHHLHAKGINSTERQ